MKLLKKGIVFLLMLTLTMGLAACGSTNSNSEGESGTETKTLRVLMGLSEQEWDVMRKDIFPKFEKEHNVKIEAVQVENEDAANKVEAQVKAGKVEIDLITQDVNYLSDFISRGLVEDLTEYKSMIPEEVIDPMIEASTFGDKLMFFPYRPNVEVAYYNENKFNEYGIKPPKTWAELYDVAKTLKEKEGIGRVAMKASLGGENMLQIFDFIRAAGGDPYVLNDQGSVEAFTFMQKLFPYLSPDSKTGKWNSLNTFIATDSVYLGQNWPYGVNIIVEQGGKKEIKTYSGWSGPQGEFHSLGGEVIAIPKGSPNKELALEFAKFLMSKDIQEILVSKLAWPSVRTDAYGQVADWQKPYFESVQEALKYTIPRGNVPYSGDMKKIVNAAFEEIVIKGADVNSTLDKYAEQLKQAKEKAGEWNF